MPRPGATAPLLSSLLLLALASNAGASTLDLYGYGARGVGMAGAVTATARGHESVYYNPAGLAFAERASFAVGFERADLFLELDGDSVDARRSQAMIIGITLPLPLGGWLERRLALGTGFVIPTDSILRADLPRPGRARFAIVENRAQVVSLQVAAGLRLHDTFAIGGGVLALAELEGAIEVAPNDQGRIGSQVRDEVLADFAGVAGASWRPTPWIAVGASWRGASRARFDLPIEVDLGETFPLPVPTLRIEGTAQYDPQQATLEVAGRPTPPLQVAAGITWKRWSAFPTLVEFTAVPAEYPAQPPPDFADTWVPRVGAEYTHVATRAPSGETATRLFARGGYAMEPTPAPEQRGFHNDLDSDRHILAAGGGVQWGALRLDVGMQWHHLAERAHHKDADAIEPFQPSTENPGFPRLSHGGDIFVFDVEVGVEL
jgi:long-subunit fatty acid transport protein